MMYRNYEDRGTPEYVFDAARKSVDELRQVLKEERLPLTVTNYAGHTLAHIAVKHDNLDVLKYVLSREPNLLNQKDNYGCSILHQAVVKGSLNSVKYLVEEQGADICRLGGQYKDRTAVHVAVEFAHLAIVKYFVEDRKVNMNSPNPSQKTPPIFLAVKKRNWDLIEYLIEGKHVDVKLLNRNQETLLFPIVRDNFMGFLKYLLDEKQFDIELNWRSISGETIVHVAADYGRLNIMEYLVDKKQARIDVRTPNHLATPLHYAAIRDDYDICQYLLCHGANPSLRDRAGYTPADRARSRKLIDYLEKLSGMRRRPRSVPSLRSPQEVVAPLKSLTPQKNIMGHAPSSVGHNEQVKLCSLGSAGNLTFQHFLFLMASSITRTAKAAKGQQNAQYFPSPTAVIRGKISSIAIDAIETGIDFSKF